eukprot:GHUV01039174.1.p2 GENE.GHUV01039174.1~~GHUV01039174.1.p2  ORF type:complete len:127 (-),score=30.78 GHUV01039174.1:687-1067(-)
MLKPCIHCNLPCCCSLAPLAAASTLYLYDTNSKLAVLVMKLSDAAAYVRGPGSRKLGRYRLNANASCSKNVSWPSNDWTAMCSTPVTVSRKHSSAAAGVELAVKCSDCYVFKTFDRKHSSSSRNMT